jgi:hypothetical protein
MNQIFIINLRGEKEPFSFKKVYNSARRVGASRKVAENIAWRIEKMVYPGMPTREIFEKVTELLHSKTPKSALRFNLKTAMRKLGPTGFPFEKFTGDIFSHQEFKVKLNQEIQGSCLKYEIDFLAEKGKILYIGECKYRNLPDNLVHSNDVLYNYAKFRDLKEGAFCQNFLKKGIDLKFVIVTNTKFTQRAIEFSKCHHFELLGWRYPKKRGLEYFIESKQLYPITILPSLTKKISSVLVEKKMMLVQDLFQINIKEFAAVNHLNGNHLEKLKKEAKIILDKKL